MNVIRMIKLFGWEPKMQERLAQARNSELKLIWTRQMLDILNGTLKYGKPADFSRHMSDRVFIKLPYSHLDYGRDIHHLCSSPPS